MPRFPTYEPEVGLDVPEAPRIQADTAMAQALVGLGHTVDQIGKRWTQRAKEQADFDDQVKYRRHSLAQAEAARRAEAGMPAQAQGFHDALMAARQQADTDFLQTISPDNRRRYAGLLSIDADRTSIAAARAEFKARGSYEQAEFGRSADEMAASVRANPALAPAALGTLKLQHDSQSSLLPAQRAAQWQGAEQALAAASWLGHYAGDAGLSRSRLEEGIKALGISSRGPDDGAGGPGLPMANGPVDPRFAALPAARRLQLATQASQALDEAKAGARAGLEQDRQAGLDGLFLGGAWQGPALPPERFIAAYGPEDGRQQFESFARLQADAPTVAALLRQPDGAQDAALNHYATAGGADGQRLHAVAAPVVARLRAERAGDPVTTLGKLYPAFGQSWAAATAADPQGFRQALPGLVDQADLLMDGLGWDRGQRRYLPREIASKTVAAFNDAVKPMAERIAPLRDVLTAVGNPAQQEALVGQYIGAGLPPMMKNAGAVFARGGAAALDRLAEAATYTPDTKATAQQPQIGVVSPLRLEIQRDLDLARNAVLLNDKRNGGDTAGSVDLVLPELFATAPLPAAGSAPVQPGLGPPDTDIKIALTALDGRPIDPTAYPLRDGATGPAQGIRLAQAQAAQPLLRGTDAVADPIIPKTEMPSRPSFKATPPGAVNDNAAPAVRPSIPAGDSPRAAPPSLPVEPAPQGRPLFRPEAFVRRFVVGNALGTMLFAAVERLSDVSEPFPGTVIPRSFTVTASGPLKVTPQATRAMVDIVERWPNGDKLDPWLRTQLQGEIIDRFGRAANGAMFSVAGQPNTYEIVSKGNTVHLT